MQMDGSYIGLFQKKKKTIGGEDIYYLLFYKSLPIR